MDNSNMALDLGLPEAFQITNDWDSHRPALYWACMNVPRGTICEFGCGDGSTYSLWELAHSQDRSFWSYETNPVWADKFNGSIVHWRSDYMAASHEYISRFKNKPGVVFIDSAPGEQRKDLIAYWSDKASCIVIHDTEPGADYVYGMRDILTTFRQRVDLHIEGAPSTTVVSNTEPLDFYSKYTVGGYKMVINDQTQYHS